MPTPMPSISSASGSQRPANNGDRYTFSGTKTVTLAFNPYADSTPPPIPSPLPTNAVTTTTSAVSQTVAVSYPATFAGMPNLYDFHVAETDTSALQRLTATSDNYEQYAAASGKTTVYAFANSEATSGGTTYVTTYGSDAYAIDLLPEMPGPIANAPSATTVVETDASGQTTQRVTNADGTYRETATYAGGTSGTATEAADGSGTYSLPFGGVGPPAYPTNTTITFGPPAAGTISIAGIMPKPGMTPAPIAAMVSDWYPNGAAVPLATRSLQSATVASLPAACALPAYVLAGRTAAHLSERDTRLDTIFGEYETTSVDSYTLSGLGVVCLQLTDMTAIYYDYRGEDTQSIGFGSVPFGSNTTSETLVLQTANVVGPNLTDRRAGFAAPTLSIAHVVTSEFRASIARQTAARHAAIARRHRMGV